MGDHKTVIVVGAGASCEFNLPVGSELMNDIAQKLSTIRIRDNLEMARPDIRKLFNCVELSAKFEKDTLVKASEKIVGGLPYAHSIDNFLHNNKDDQAIITVGKIAISSVIIEKEKMSPLYKGQAQSNPNGFRTGVVKNDSWLHRYFTILVSKKSFKQFLATLENITFVSFNYDRCIQQFFCNATTAYFTTISDAAEQVLKSLNVIYPYGTVGNFLLNSDGSSTYGNDSSQDNILNSINSIRTFTEGGGEATSMQIRDKMHEAEVILFLGFGFIPMNWDFLFKNDRFDTKKVLCTAYGISETDRVGLKKKLINTFFNKVGAENQPYHNPVNGFVRIEDFKASELFHEFSQFLSHPKRLAAESLLRLP